MSITQLNGDYSRSLSQPPILQEPSSLTLFVFSILYPISLSMFLPLSADINMLIAFRVLGGLGIGGSVPIVFSLGAEVFPSPRRGYFLSIIASFWMVGAIYTAFTAWILLGKDTSGQRIVPGVSWRVFAVISALPAVIAFLLTYWKVPESPRFLIRKGRCDDAAVVLCSLSTVRVLAGDLARPGVEAKSTRTSTSPAQDQPSTAVHTSSPSIYSTIQLLLGQQYRLSSAVLLGIWFTLSFGSYGISTWISILFKDVGIGNAFAASFIYALANLPGNAISLWLVYQYGRRALLGWGTGLAGLSALGFALDTKQAVVVVGFASLFNAFSTMGWNSLDCLSAEMFPTEARSTAMGLLAASGRLGAIAGQFVNGTLESNIPLLLFVTTACCVCGGAIAFALPHDSAGPLDQASPPSLDSKGHLSAPNYSLVSEPTSDDGQVTNPLPVDTAH
jgi:MFS family permease